MLSIAPQMPKLIVVLWHLKNEYQVKFVFLLNVQHLDILPVYQAMVDGEVIAMGSSWSWVVVVVVVVSSSK